MSLQWTPYSLVLAFAAIISAVAASFAWKRRAASGAIPFAVFMLGLSLWALGDALIWASANLSSQAFWNNLSYLGIVMVPTSWFIFAFQYTGLQKWLGKREVVLLCIEPVLTLLFAWSSNYHVLFWTQRWSEDLGILSIYRVTHGPLFWLHTSYSYVLCFVATLIFVGQIIRFPSLYREQTVALLVGAVMPWLANVIYVFHLNLFAQIDLTPLAFLITGSAFSWAFFRFRLFDLAPVARDVIFETMGDGVLIVDNLGRIMDMNQVMCHLLGDKISRLVGQPITQALTSYPDLMRALTTATGRHAEIFWIEGEEGHFFDVVITPLHSSQGRLTGRLITLRDITRRREAEEALKKAYEELEQRVQDRTCELAAANESLLAEIAERNRIEGALRESEERYRLHFENMNDVIYSIGPDFNLLTISPSVERYLGYRPEELIGRHVGEMNLLSPGYLEVAFEDISRALAGELRPSQMYEFIAKDGTRRIGELTGAPLYRDGQVIAVITVARDITERVRTDEQLKASLAEKEILLKEIHHRVKNNLQIVSSLLYLQSGQVHDEQVLDVLKESQNRVRSMAFVHERLYQSEDLARVNFVEYIRSLGHYLFQSYGMDGSMIHFIVEGEEALLDIDMAMPCGLLLNELLSNALKHAFPAGRRGEIRVSFYAHVLDGKRFWKLIVADDGVGLPPKFDLITSESLGLRLANTLVGQINGEIRIDRRYGTAFEITFADPSSEFAVQQLMFSNTREE